MRRLAAAAVLTLIAGAMLVLGGGAAAAPTPSQRLFERTLLADEQTSAQVKSLLRDGGGFVARDVRFADVTGDGRSDALAMVETGGAAGAVALYVLSTHGAGEDADLRAVYRSQRLYRAGVRPERGGLVVRTPRYSRADALCCPSGATERFYSWSDAARTLRRRSVINIEEPGG